MPSYATVKAKVQSYLGVPEDTPASVNTLDFIRNHDSDIKTGVSRQHTTADLVQVADIF
jgi:hypothetical protein